MTGDTPFRVHFITKVSQAYLTFDWMECPTAASIRRSQEGAIKAYANTLNRPI